MPVDVSAARTFVHANGRLLERRLFGARFEGADADAVVRAVAAYQNADGGFGHGLEPDKRCPASQPLDVEIALERLVTVGAGSGSGDSAGRPYVAALVAPAFDFLASVADADGAVPVLLPSIAGYPRAAHWSADRYEPGPNPTASIAGYGRALGVDHPWLDRASNATVTALERGDPPAEAHTLLCLARFLEHFPERSRAVALAAPVAEALPTSGLFQPRPVPDTYGLGPLDFAPAPASLARAWFDETTIAVNLDHLEASQQDDGGWPITWEPPSEASRCEWRAIRTLDALGTLTAYGRLSR